MACRDLVIENGPFGMEGSVATYSGDQLTRAKKYTTAVESVTEILIAEPMAKGLNAADL